MKLIIKAADYALTRSVMFGILQGCRDGLIGCTGLMTNLPWSGYAADLIQPYSHVCLGQDINITVGRPVANPKEIPSLVNDDGTFINSTFHRDAKEDVVVFEEAVLETEAQVKNISNSPDTCQNIYNPTPMAAAAKSSFKTPSALWRENTALTAMTRPGPI